MICSRFVLALPCALFACQSEVPRPPSADETCFGLTWTNDGGKQYCDAQACFAKSFAVVDQSGTGAGFQCGSSSGTCPKPDAQFLSTDTNPMLQGYGYVSKNQSVGLLFDNRLLVEGYSLANFKKYVRGGTITVDPDPTYDALSGEGTPEIVAYDQGVLHVRMTADAHVTKATVDTAPYLCNSSGEINTPSLCDTAPCEYRDATQGGAGDPIHLSADLNLPIAPVAP